MTARRSLPWLRIAGALCLAGLPALAAEQVIAIDGTVAPGDPDHVQVPFTVPEGIAEVEVDHQNLDGANVLDFGVLNPDGGSRGWGGGNTEPAVFGAQAASRSYHPGPVGSGTYSVVVGKAKLVHTPAPFHLDIHLRDTATLAPQAERSPYVPADPLEVGPRWYAGDFHVHSRESGDARPDLDTIAELARSRGLDFVELSDHNVTTQLDFINAAQARHPDLLFLPGFEFTTYHGHANAIGGTVWIDSVLGVPGHGIQEDVDAIHAQGALFSINHPTLELPGVCLGCAWDLYVPPIDVDAVEVANGGWSEVGSAFDERSLTFWTDLCRGGHHIAAVGGSDDHRAGEETSSIQSPIGDPTTLVYADALDAASILEGIRQGRTVVKLQGPGDPMVELGADVPITDSTVRAAVAHLTATVTGGVGTQLRFVHDGERLDPIEVTSDPFTAGVDAPAAPDGGESFWRAEVWTEGHPITVTSHLWVVPPDATPLTPQVSTGCSCRAPGSAPRAPLALLLLSLTLFAARRRSRGDAVVAGGDRVG